MIAIDPDTTIQDPNQRDRLTYRLSGTSDFNINANGVIFPIRPFGLAEVALQTQFVMTAKVKDKYGAEAGTSVRINIKRPVKAIGDTIQLTRLASDIEVESTFSVLTNDFAHPNRTKVDPRQGPTDGTIIWDTKNLGFFKYKANDNDPDNFPMSDSFTYRLVDNATGDVSNDVTVSLTFGTHAEPALVAVNDVRTVTIDPNETTYTFDGPSDSVVLNDTYPTGTQLQQITTTQYGNVTLANDGTFTYTVTSSHFGPSITDSFSYKLTNGSDKSTARVDIRFTEPTPQIVNPNSQRPPRFKESYYSFTYQELSSGQAIIKAIDDDNDAVTISLVPEAHPPWVKGTPTAPGEFRLERNLNAPPPKDGIYTFAVTVTDNQVSPVGNIHFDLAYVYIYESTAGDQSPVFKQTNAGGPDLYTVTVDPTTLVGTRGLVATGEKIEATDPIGEPITYMLLVPGCDQNFSAPVFVNPETGEIFVSNGLWESVGGNVTHEYDVVARDEDHNMAITKLRINVNLANYTAKLFVKGQGDTSDIVGNDVNQGGIGDCWFLSALGAIADRSPQLIRSMIQVQNGQYRVRFFKRIAPNGPFVPVWITVSYDLTGNAGAAIGADIDGQNQVEVWVRIVERAYIQFMGGVGYIGPGGPATAWEHITGYPAHNVNAVNQQTANQIKAALIQGKLVWVATVKQQVLPAGVVGFHIYQIAGFLDASQNYVRLRNPHGSNDVTISLATLANIISAWWTE